MKQHCPAKLDHTFCGLETRMWPGIVMLQEYFLLSSSATNSRLQFDQWFNVIFRDDSCLWFQEIQEDNALCILENKYRSLYLLSTVT